MSRKLKDSGVEWIGDIPEGWKIARVKNMFYRKKEKAEQENPVVLSLARSGVKIRDISTNEGQIAENYENYNPVQAGDFLINPMDLYSGANCNVSEVEGVISPAYINLRVLGLNNAKYFDYYFKTQYWGMVLFSHGKGVSFENRWTINNETLMNYFIPLPKEFEQSKIASFLDFTINQIDSIIERTKETINNYKSLKQSIITEVVTKGVYRNIVMKESSLIGVAMMPKEWKITSLKRIAYIRYGLGQPPAQSLEGLPIIRATNVDAGKIIVKNMIYAQLKDIQTAKDVILSEGDIIIVRSGAYAGDVGYINEEWAGSIAGYDMILSIRENNSKFIMYTLLSAYVLDNQIMLMRMRAAQPHLNAEEVGSLKIVLPSLGEQNEIVQYLDKKCEDIDSLIRQKQKLVEEIEYYKKSLIFECVTGKREVI